MLLGNQTPVSVLIAQLRIFSRYEIMCFGRYVITSTWLLRNYKYSVAMKLCVSVATQL